MGLGQVPHPGHSGHGVESEHQNVHAHRVLTQREDVVPVKRLMNVSSNLTLFLERGKMKWNVWFAVV